MRSQEGKSNPVEVMTMLGTPSAEELRVPAATCTETPGCEGDALDMECQEPPWQAGFKELKISPI